MAEPVSEFPTPMTPIAAPNTVQAAVAAVQAAVAPEPVARPAVSTAVPYERFAEVNTEKKQAMQMVDDLRNQLEEKKSSERHLSGKLTEAESLIEGIKGLYDNDKYRPHVEAIDRALRGLDDEVDTLKTKEAAGGDDRVAAEIKQLRVEKEKLIDQVQTDRANLIMEDIKQTVQAAISSLPEEYLPEDRKMLTENWWYSRIPWKALEEDPSSKDRILSASFKQLLSDYGAPRGYVPAASHEETALEEQARRILTPSPKEELETLLSTNWGALSKDGKGFAVDDPSFNKVLSRGLHLSREVGKG